MRGCRRLFLDTERPRLVRACAKSRLCRQLGKHIRQCFASDGIRRTRRHTDLLSLPPGFLRPRGLTALERNVRFVILTGGTGSIALQRGLYHAVEDERDGIDIKVIVNAYDNGLSTGAVRYVMGNRILGPSDVRKNQTTRLQLQDPSSPWIGFLNCRFTSHPLRARELCIGKITQLVTDLERQDRCSTHCRILLNSIEAYFASPLAMKIAYEDFALANILYAGLARMHGDSLRAAARIMAEALGIPDNVLLNDDRSLFLGAVTRSGRRIADEGEIVSWGNEEDPFVDLFFADANGAADRPELCLEAWQALMEADVVILSSGTQWSSLIPTYASGGFRAAINASQAKILMVMNRTPDRDSPGQSASDIVDILVPRFFENGRLHILADQSSHARMRSLNATALSKVASFTPADLSCPGDPPDKHDATKLSRAIGAVYFRDYIDSDFYLFDYDDTLLGRQDSFPKSSKFNVSGIARLNELTGVGICTGNTIQALSLRGVGAGAGEWRKPASESLLVFADGGVNKYSYDLRLISGDETVCVDVAQCLSPETLLPTTGPFSVERIILALKRAGIPDSKIGNRANVIIAIKPIEYRHRCAALSLVRHVVAGSGLEVREAGRTTIEIRRPTLSKVVALKHLLENCSTPPRITYVGDECESGNDREIEEFAGHSVGVRCLHVQGPSKTAFFISTLLAKLEGKADVTR
jgi:2-phospho-L-lactate transferase/gluconeogenesis factor (CofD/UPF0052 family)